MSDKNHIIEKKYRGTKKVFNNKKPKEPKISKKKKKKEFTNGNSCWRWQLGYY